jgi:(+)-neomenthol dehydrogenase
MQPDGEEVWNEIETQSFELAEQCIKTNYYGVRGMVEALTPLLQLSDSARIINVTSKLGLLKVVLNNSFSRSVTESRNLAELFLLNDNISCVTVIY